MSEEEFNENELLFDELYEKTKDCGRVQFINLIMEKERENQELKKQLEELEEQNFNLREDIMLKKMAFPHEKIKDKSLYDLYDMPSYSDLAKENQQYKEAINKINVFLDNHDKNAGKLYYKYDNKYSLSEIKEDLRDILKEVE